MPSVHNKAYLSLKTGPLENNISRIRLFYYQYLYPDKTDEKDFCTISRTITLSICKLEEIGKNFNSSMLENFKTYGVAVKEVEDIQMSNKVYWGSPKISHSDVMFELKNFHQKVKKSFASTLVFKLKDAINISYQVIESSLLKRDPILLLATTQERYGKKEMKTLQDCY